LTLCHTLPKSAGPIPVGFIFLIDQSGSMVDPIAGSEGKRKCDSVADAINGCCIISSSNAPAAKGAQFLRSVRHRYGEKVGVVQWQVGGRTLVPVSDVAQAPARVEERVKKIDDGAGGVIEQKVKFPVWFEPVAKGVTPMGAALTSRTRADGMGRQASGVVSPIGSIFPR